VRNPQPMGRGAFSSVIESSDLAFTSSVSNKGIWGEFSEKSKPQAWNPGSLPD
jgi:hypothetical protein